jgi:hypothetical protein
MLLTLRNGAGEMTMINYPSGLRRTYGHPIITGSYLYTSSANVWWVHSETGSDTSSYGKDEAKPMASLVYAIPRADAGDIICVMDGHTETLVADLAVDKQLFICADGRSNDEPTCSIVANASGSSLAVTLSAAGTLWSNFKHVGNVHVGAGPSWGTQLNISNSDIEVSDCYFDVGGRDTRGVSITTGSFIRFERNMVVSRGVDAAFRPETGVLASAVADLVVRDNVFDNGTWGWGSIYAFDATNNQLTRARFSNNSQLRGADFRIGTADPVNSYFAGGLQTGGAMLRTYT